MNIKARRTIKRNKIVKLTKMGLIDVIKELSESNINIAPFKASKKNPYR